MPLLGFQFTVTTPETVFYTRLPGTETFEGGVETMIIQSITPFSIIGFLNALLIPTSFRLTNRSSPLKPSEIRTIQIPLTFFALPSLGSESILVDAEMVPGSVRTIRGSRLEATEESLITRMIE